MEIRFKGKVAAITGAGNGLGRDYALFLASRGARVVVNDLGTSYEGQGSSGRPAQAVVKEIKSNGGRAVANFDSVAEVNGAQRIVQTALSHFGSCDILINNAGILRSKIFLNLSPDDFEDTLKVHLLGSIYTTMAAVPIMKQQKYGRIVLTASGAGLYGVYGSTAYGAAKMGIIGLMNTLKLEVEKYNIMVNTVAPMAETRMSRATSVFPQTLEPHLKADRVTAVVAYLCSDACHTTGDILSVGAGYCAKAQLFEGRGAWFDPQTRLTPEMIAEKYGQIEDMSGARGFRSAEEWMDLVLKPVLNT